MSKTLSTQLSLEITSCQSRPLCASVYNNLFSQCKHSWLVGRVKLIKVGDTANDLVATVCGLGE